MDLGIAMFPTDEAIAPAALARRVEERGFESLFFPEHTHIPASRESPYPGGGELPRMYTRTYDPFVALTSAAAATERILLGTGICLIVERDPIVTAKSLASLDVLSGGRAVFGVGAGWNREEMRNHGTGFGSRFAVMRERVEAIRAIWTEDEASYHGAHVDFERIWCWPKPARRPHPPVLVGGNGPRVLERVRAYGDGWMPNASREGEEKLRARVRDAVAEGVAVTVYGCPPDAGAVERYGEAGASRCVFWVPSEPAEKVEPRLDAYAKLV